MFSGGCVFIDHISVYVIIKHQVAINNTESVKAKLTFEREAQSQGVVIKVYHTDNGIFNASSFMKNLLKQQQKIRFSGAEASHQNGAPERSIKMVATMETTMLMHAALRCPEDTLSTDFWPMEMQYYVWVYNQIPDMQSGLSAIEIWSRLIFEPVSEILSNYHFWGCTTYVLEPKLQKPVVKILKWTPRSQRGVNMGFINMHSTQVQFFLNLRTVSIADNPDCISGI